MLVSILSSDLFSLKDMILTRTFGTGGRCVKWLRKIWVSEKENDSHYHIWDNRVLVSDPQVHFLHDRKTPLKIPNFQVMTCLVSEQLRRLPKLVTLTHKSI